MGFPIRNVENDDNRIVISGARENSLKNVSLSLPREELIVFTGVSGSGKSSLAFDTIYAEGQMRYVESLSSYARQFLGQRGKPDVDSIEGLSPAIAIEQKSTSGNPRSTVGTVTEIYDYLRLLWARIGIPHCPKCGKEIKRQSVDQIADQIMTLPEGTRFQVLAPVVHGKKGEQQKLLENIRKGGYVRVRVDGSIYDLSEEIRLDKNLRHNIDVVVDRLVVNADNLLRIANSVEAALILADGLVVIQQTENDSEEMFSQSYACPDCGISLPELSPRMFSFNSPYGACKTCSGLGFFLKIDPELVIADKNLPLRKGAIAASGWRSAVEGSISCAYYTAIGEKYGFTVNTPLRELSQEALDAILFGTGKENLDISYSNYGGFRSASRPFEGIVANLERRYREQQSDEVRRELESYMSAQPCPDCRGDRLSPVVLGVTVGGKNISDFCKLTILQTRAFIDSLTLTPSEEKIADSILNEIRARLDFLQKVGLGYLTLSRMAGTLSGGESQRIRLATQIGSGLMGVLYVLDEPSIGLHQRDNEKLLSSLESLRDLGNTLIVVEHNQDTILRADWIVDIGPGAGINGGEIVAQGRLKDILAEQRSITGQYLSGQKSIPVPVHRRTGNGHMLSICGAAENNLKHIDVQIPLGTLTCVTGVSGSGKSSLINEILYKKLAHDLNHARTRTGAHDRIEGLEYLDKVINIDQSPIGRTPRSNPATYTGLFEDIRALFASTSEAKARAYGPGRFSFNVRGGRCEACCGDGLIKIEMHFLPDLYVPCDVCKGKRYNRETLEVRFKGKNIAEVLDMTADEALAFFENIPKLWRKTQALCDVGLGYIRLGQSSTTLSGGEAQRVKLAAELLKPATGATIYILDEPTTGLHMADIHILLDTLQKLVDAGNTVVVIEHDMDVIKSADWIIDLGPEGGDEGGNIVFAGTPEQIASCSASYTGQFLKKCLLAK
ncbi:excinuclease ABC subunit UvrA [Oscillibacter sp.]|uniref:excinuclease ABC subunit UvrA n=1 Tax=Oscillibacter sp. TaxID=1945593 RepID=UPI00339347D8